MSNQQKLDRSNQNHVAHNLSQLLHQATPLTRRQFLRRRCSFGIKISLIVLVFFIAMTFLIPEFRAVWPFFIFVEFVIFGILGAYLLAYERWKFELAVYEHGVIAQTSVGKHMAQYKDLKVWKGTSIISQKGGIRLGPSLYTLQFPDGFQRRISIVYDGYYAYQELAEQILETLNQTYFTQALATLNAGENLEFGIVTLNREGLKVTDKKFLWSDGYSVTLSYFLSEPSTGTFRVKRQNGGLLDGAGVIYSGVPNAPIFLGLLQQLDKLTLKMER